MQIFSRYTIMEWKIKEYVNQTLNTDSGYSNELYSRPRLDLIGSPKNHSYILAMNIYPWYKIFILRARPELIDFPPASDIIVARSI